MTIRRHLRAKAGAAVLAAGLAGGAAVALPGTAQAGVCLGLTSSSSSCSTVGTATLTGGGLTMVSPLALTWTGSITGAAQTIYDTSLSDTSLDVLDLRGLLSTSTGAGWNITATATPFTGLTTGKVLTDTPGGSILAFGGGSTAATAGNTPSSVCVITGTCTPAITNVTGYPLFVPTGTAATPVKIYNATVGTGTGTVQIGSSLLVPGANPAVWSITLPSGVAADAYASTITMTIASGP